jgi:hypothetical protein
MSFVKYVLKQGKYMDTNGAWVDAFDGSTDPLSKRIVIGPLAFLHVHRLSWDSSDGDLASLNNVKTRERVSFRQPTQAAPFCDFADPDQFFTQVGADGQLGGTSDDHSVMIPSLICCNPRQAGTLIGEQWYQYSLDGVNYQNIEGAAFLLEKSVSQDSKGWVLTFRKKNWSPHNPTPFLFEISYRIGTMPLTMPRITPNSHPCTLAAPFITGGATRYLAGANEGTTYSDSGDSIEVDLAYLKKRGYLA